MKQLNKTISALVIAAGFAAAAQAQDGSVVGTPIFITGSTAFRGQVFAGLKDMGLTTVAAQDASGSNWFTLSGAIADGTSGNLPSLTQVGQQVTAFCSWSGSVEGVQSLVTGTTTATYENVDAAGFYSGTFTHTGADIALSDIGQTSCYQGQGGSAVNFTPAKTGTTLVEVQLPADAALPEHTGIAVQPFTFVVNGNAGTISNITENNFLDLYLNGQLAKSYFTGVPSDSNVTVQAVGRYNLSGTRATAVIDFGGSQKNNLSQWALSADGSTTPGLASTDTTPVPSTGNQWLSVGNNGYYSGGNTGTAINASSVNGAPAAIAYIAWGDSSKIQAPGTAGAYYAGPINYQGQVPWVGGLFPNVGGWNINGVENGSYTLWTYERMYVSPAISGGSDPNAAFKIAFAKDLIQAIQYEIVTTKTKFGSANNIQTAVLESAMGVYRTGDGGDVTLNP